MDRGPDGPGQRRQPANGRLPDGPAGPEDRHGGARAAVRRHVDAGAVRAHHGRHVRGPAAGRPGQGRIVHGGARVPGRGGRPRRPRRPVQRVLPAAARRLPVRGGRRPVDHVPRAQRRVRRVPVRLPAGRRLGARVAALSAGQGPAGPGRAQPPVVPESRFRARRRRRRAPGDRDGRPAGDGEPVDVPRAVHQPEGRARARRGGGRVRRATGRRRELHTRVLVAHTAAQAGRRRARPVRLRHTVRRPPGGRQPRERRRRGPRGPQTAAGRLRGLPGRHHVRDGRPLLRGPAVPGPVAAVPVLRAVRRRVRRRRRFHPGRLPRRAVPGQRALALFRHRVHHAGRLLVRHQQDVPAGVPPVRVPRHVRRVRGRQRRRRRVLVPVRGRDQGQDVRGDPTAAPGRRGRRRPAQARRRGPENRRRGPENRRRARRQSRLELQSCAYVVAVVKTNVSSPFAYNRISTVRQNVSVRVYLCYDQLFEL